ncbi:RDD family protein [Actinacidiphila yeochonensis]|uniref:RDD family protein n=1 Tax=Actinacidiphila yeochonensis TaxID=89050 RepID=UPI0005636BD4|nr:RDD family protein [Actinacidiphila yeochonensis]
MTMLGRDTAVPVAGSAAEAARGKNPLNGVRPAGVTMAYTRARVEGTLPPGGGSPEVELAPTGRRFAALVLDLVIAAVSLVVPAMLALVLQNLVNPDGNGYFMLGTWLIGFVWLTFYGTACVALWGGTPGLLIAGLRVACVWQGTQRPTWQHAYRRARLMAVLAWLIPALNITVVLVRLGSILRERPYHHGFFDTAAGTVIIRHR